jgi:hypothetical protein
VFVGAGSGSEPPQPAATAVVASTTSANLVDRLQPRTTADASGVPTPAGVEPLRPGHSLISTSPAELTRACGGLSVMVTTNSPSTGPPSLVTALALPFSPAASS